MLIMIEYHYSHLMRITSDRNTKGPGEAKVSQLQFAFAIYEKILGF